MKITLAKSIQISPDLFFITVNIIRSTLLYFKENTSDYINKYVQTTGLSQGNVDSNFLSAYSFLFVDNLNPEKMRLLC